MSRLRVSPNFLPSAGSASPAVSPRILALVAVALSVHAVGCGDSTDTERACGANADGQAQGLAALPAPTAVWSRAAVDAIYYNPRAADLDGDGVLEVLLAGGNEAPAFGEIRVLEAATGALRWGYPAEQELYTSPLLLDVTGDGVQDVFVGGRLSTFLSIDGASGRELWHFEDKREFMEYNFYNFYTPVFVPDQSGDGLPELLLATGGADGIPAVENRPPGHLLVLNSRDGSLLAFAKVPDGRETYMSPILLPDDGAASPTILFGTGGETWAGSFWQASLSDVLAGDLSSAKKLVAGSKKGMLAPPSLADLDLDGRLDILLATFDGHLIALNGVTKAVMWERVFSNAESYSTPVLGYFDRDDVPDVLAVFLHGEFPDYVSAERALLSGRDGSVIWRGEEGDFAMGTDVAIDLDGDGLDEVIFNANTLHNPVTGRRDNQSVHLLDSACASARKWGTTPTGFAAGSPWVGDLDGDGVLDLLMPRHSANPALNDGLLTRFRVETKVPKQIRWGGYFGTKLDSVIGPRG